ncbi:response regulator transcription factor [Oceanirhabdus seepicola]|uniref:Stage 0 sporulation protein A homolog n=1 Tax=Oceanirhabdus seepicola TaxID=2828781 RepID=A0A9J6P1Q2_9CLOT|nr:response regulator transcription factor [Oceanirhabdus seepicola]MCM1990324.1 response regulator transcription factor [Oceanirhabdus seepicola]
MEKIKVLITDDEKLISEGLSIILNTYEDIEVVGTACNGRKALEKCGEIDVDIVLMDIRMPICDGVMGTKLIKEQYSKVKVLILTTFKDTEYIFDAMKYGASGYLLKESSYDLIYEGIKSTYKGNVVVHPDIANSLVKQQRDDKSTKDEVKEKYSLTKREMTIIQEIGNGLSNREIAEILFLTEGTIKNNISNILSKLNLRDRTQVAIFAVKNNLSTN